MIVLELNSYENLLNHLSLDLTMEPISRSEEFTTDNARWAAVVARDRTADGLFVYCVRTTGIYCRPICKSRLARRSNVEFCTLTRDAVKNGYRACKRCRPDLPSFNPEADVVRKVCKMIQNHPQNAPLPRLESLAHTAGLTKSHFHRLFKKETGVTPREYAITWRQSQDNDLSNRPSTVSTPGVSNLSSDIGTDDTLVDEDFWSPQAKEDEKSFDIFDPDLVGDCEDHTQMQSFDASETEVRSVFSPETNIPISFLVKSTSHGPLLVAFNDDQICRLELGESEAELLEHLRETYPSWLYTCEKLKEQIELNRVKLERVNAIVEAVERPSGKMLELRLDPSLLLSGIEPL